MTNTEAMNEIEKIICENQFDEFKYQSDPRKQFEYNKSFLEVSVTEAASAINALMSERMKAFVDWLILNKYERRVDGDWFKNLGYGMSAGRLTTSQLIELFNSVQSKGGAKG